MTGGLVVTGGFSDWRSGSNSFFLVTGGLVVTGGFSDWTSGSNRRFTQFIVHSSLLPPLKLDLDEINRERENG